MKQHNPSKKSSRRNFTKSIACALVATPVVSTYGSSPQPGAEATEPAPPFSTTPTILSPVIFKDHIPPIEILSDLQSQGTEATSGLVSLLSAGQVRDSTRSTVGPQTGKQIIEGRTKIIGVRVIMTDGTIKADYKDDPAVKGGQIKIWVKDPDNSNHDMLLKTVPGSSESLQVEMRDNMQKFNACNGCPNSHRRYRYSYSDSNNGILKAVILKRDGNETLAEIKISNEQVIDRILIW